MCGIIGCVGKNKVIDYLIHGLRRMEYRGYDSAGVAILGDEMKRFRAVGNVDCLASVLPENLDGFCGIAHTRWATHGKPSEENAHPHCSFKGLFTLVHNGIIENSEEIKSILIREGYSFYSDTDTEVLLNLIESEFQQCGDVARAIRRAIEQIKGAYAFAMLKNDDPEILYACRQDSALIVAETENEFFLASDLLAFPAYAERLFFPDEKDIVVLHKQRGIFVLSENGERRPDFIVQTGLAGLQSGSKDGYEDYMLKEIYEQEKSVLRAMSCFPDSFELPEHIRRIVIIACGTSWHAGILGQYCIERFSGIPVKVEYASEFRYREPVLMHDDWVVAISQSGETADTIGAVRMVKRKGIHTLAICNVERSTLVRETDNHLLLNAGAEIGVASTKAFTSQSVVLLQLALFLAHRNDRIDDHVRLIEDRMSSLSIQIRNCLRWAGQIEYLAAKYRFVNSFLFIGRGLNFPIALEGALKLKEISYVHAEGYPGAEMKHGPIALIDSSVPTFAVVTDSANRDKMIANIREIQARDGKIIALVREGDQQIINMVDDAIELPAMPDELMAILSVIPLQLFAYFVAKLKGCNVDQPRNLAKAVTVE